MNIGTILAHSGDASVVFDWLCTRDFGVKGKLLQSILTGADSGGHTGIIRELTQYLWNLSNFRELYSLLTSEEIDAPPLGDLRNQISRWSELYGKLFKRRLEDGKFEKAAFSLLVSLITDPQNKIEKAGIGEMLFRSYYGEQRDYDSDDLAFVLERRFQKYLELFKQAAQSKYSISDSNEEKGNEENNEAKGTASRIEVKHSVGNLILHFLYIECVQAFKNRGPSIESSTDFDQEKVSVQELFFGLLRNLNLIPKNLWLRILRERGLHLQAITEKGERIKGEGVIDNMETGDKLLAESYKLFINADCTEEVTDIEGIQNLFDTIVETTAYWIVPPGSVANWLPIINQFGDKIRASGKPVYMFANSFIQENEPVLLDQIKQVVAKVGRIQLIIPEINPDRVDGYAEYYASVYEEQRKLPVNFDELESKVKEEGLDVGIHRVLNWTVFAPGQKGLKYSEYEVSLILSLVGASLDNKDGIREEEIKRILKVNELRPSESLLSNINKFLQGNSEFLEIMDIKHERILDEVK